VKGGLILRAGFLQFAPVFGDVRGNLDRIEARLAGARADVVVLPELCTTGYQFTDRAEALALAEPVPGPATERLVRAARALGGVIVAGLAERVGDDACNAAVAVDATGVRGVYRKVHLFFEETQLFRPGTEGFLVVPTPRARLGLMVCFDWFFPETARSLALQGADVLCHPANLVLPWCQAAMVTRCLENRVFAITANRTGAEERGGKPRLAYTGRSQVLGVRGETLAAAGADEEVLALVDLDPAAARDKRLNEWNDLFRDRAPSLYGTLTRP
jgi:predicted amidohydrolase